MNIFKLKLQCNVTIWKPCVFVQCIVFLYIKLYFIAVVFRRWDSILNLTLDLTLEGPCIIVWNIYTFQRDTQCSSTDCLLMLRCQLYMFRTVTVHPQELLFRCCMCRLWYVVRNALSDTSRWYNVWGRMFTSFKGDFGLMKLLDMYIWYDFRDSFLLLSIHLLAVVGSESSNTIQLRGHDCVKLQKLLKRFEKQCSCSFWYSGRSEHLLVWKKERTDDHRSYWK